MSFVLDMTSGQYFSLILKSEKRLFGKGAVGAVQYAAGKIFDDIGVVGRDDNCGAATVDFAETIHYVPSVLGVDVTGRFIGEYQFRTVEKSAGNNHALLFASRQCMRELVAFIKHSHELERLFNALLDICFVFPACSFQHEAEIVVDAAVVKQAEVLKNDAYVAAQKWNVFRLNGVEAVA